MFLYAKGQSTRDIASTIEELYDIEISPSLISRVTDGMTDQLNGVAQVGFIGVTNPQNPRVETAQDVCDDFLLAAKHIP